MNQPSVVTNFTDDEFDTHIRCNNAQQLLETARSLQTAMADQQALFDRLKGCGTAPGSEQDRALAGRMEAVQGTLAQLMTRNMKCFIRQSALQKEEALLAEDAEDDNNILSSPIPSDHGDCIATEETDYMAESYTDSSSELNSDDQAGSTQESAVHPGRRKDKPRRKAFPWISTPPNGDATVTENGSPCSPAERSGKFMFRSSHSCIEPSSLKTAHDERAAPRVETPPTVRQPDATERPLEESVRTVNEQPQGTVTGENQSKKDVDVQRKPSAEQDQPSTPPASDENPTNDNDTSFERINFSSARRMFEAKGTDDVTASRIVATPAVMKINSNLHVNTDKQDTHSQDDISTNLRCASVAKSDDIRAKQTAVNGSYDKVDVEQPPRTAFTTSLTNFRLSAGNTSTKCPATSVESANEDVAASSPVVSRSSLVSPSSGGDTNQQNSVQKPRSSVVTCAEIESRPTGNVVGDASDAAAAVVTPTTAPQQQHHERNTSADGTEAGDVGDGEGIGASGADICHTATATLVMGSKKKCKADVEIRPPAGVTASGDRRHDDTAAATDATDGGRHDDRKVSFVESNNNNCAQESVTLREETVSSPAGDASVMHDGGSQTAAAVDVGVACTDDDKVQERVTLKNWDPSKLLEDLYKIQLLPEAEEHCSYINMEGYLEKLPINKKKATLLKTWKRRYFKAFNGNLYYYEMVPRQHNDMESSRRTSYVGNASDRSHGLLQLMGGSVEDLQTNRMLGIDDGKGHYLLVRCPNEDDFQKWKRALQSQTTGNVSATYVKPTIGASPSSTKKVVILDIGSCSVRAGILREQTCLPDVFFPTVVAVDDATGAPIEVGAEAYKPAVRHRGSLLQPVRPSLKGDRLSLAMDRMPALIGKVFSKLQVDPTQYWVMFSAPANLSDKTKEFFMKLFVEMFHVRGVNIVSQTLLAMYSYNATSGIAVDIGDRLDIMPIADGYIVKEGVTRQPYGGHRITDALNTSFTERRYRFFTQVEFLIVRQAMEKFCFVAENYHETSNKCKINSSDFKKSIDLHKYDLPSGSWTSVENDEGRFKSPEGLFDLSVWGLDNEPLHKLIYKAVQACPMDTRREMWRSIYLSGGATQLPGFVERLHNELSKLVPPSIVIQIHASTQRYHAAYIGACTLASLAVFEQSSISAEQWRRQGAAALAKWHMY